MRRLILGTLVTVLMSCAIVVVAAFAVPAKIPYSGQLTESGSLVNGMRYFQFQIYDAATGGTPLYAQSESLLVGDGVYHTELNAPVVIWTGADRWLAISVNGGVDLAPRTRVGTVPYAIRAQLADSATNVPQKSAWQVVFAGATNIAPGVWVDVGPELTITTAGGPLLIVVDVYANGGSHATFQPVVDGVWAGSYSGMLNPGDIYWKEGLLFTGTGTWHQWNKTKIYPGIGAGTHVVKIQAAGDGAGLVVGNQSIPCSLQVIELQRMN